MFVRIWTSRALLPAMAVAIAAGLMIAPQAQGVPQAQGAPQSQRADHEKQAQAERALQEAMASAERALQDQKAALAEALQEVAALQEVGERAELEGRLRHLQAIEGEQADRLRQRMRVIAPQLARARAYSIMGGSGADRILAHAEDLGLTEDQQERLRAADKANRRASIERDAQIEVAELDLEDMTRDLDAADLDAIEGKMLEISQLKVAGRVADLRLRQQLNGILTQEQRDKLQDMRGGHLMFMREGGPGILRFKGEGGADIEVMPGGNEFIFGPGELFEPFEWIEDLRFEAPHGVYEFRLRPDDQDQDVEAPPAGVMKKKPGTTGSSAPSAAQAPKSTRSS